MNHYYYLVELNDILDKTIETNTLAKIKTLAVKEVDIKESWQQNITRFSFDKKSIIFAILKIILHLLL